MKSCIEAFLELVSGSNLLQLALFIPVLEQKEQKLTKKLTESLTDLEF